MTSNRRRWRSSRGTPALRRAIVIALCLAAFGVAIFAFRNVVTDRADPAAARASVLRAESFLAASNATAARSQALDAVRADPASGAVHVVLARALLGLDDGVGAEAALRRATDTGEDPRRVRHLMAHALLLQGDAQRALTEADGARPEHRAYALRIRARALTTLGNLGAAQAAALAAVRSAPNYAPAWTDLGRFRLQAGDLAGAIAAAERAVALDRGSVDALVLRGELVRTQFGLVAALPWFERALQRDPYHHDALIEYAATLGDVGRASDMLAAARRAMLARPGSPQAVYLQAVLAARAARFDLARTLLERTGGAIDGTPGVLLLGGMLDLQSGAHAQAIAKLQQLLGDQPMNVTARRLLATALLRGDAAKNAIDLMRPLVARGDADSYAFALVGRGFERIGERAYAGLFLDRAATPGRRASSAFSSDDSLPVLGAAAATAPDNPEAIIPAIRGLIGAGDLSAALMQAQRIAARNPGAPAAQLLVGDVLMLMNRSADAVAAFKRAADIRFDQPAMLRLVEAMDCAGSRDEAAGTLALFLSQNPTNMAALRLAAHWQLAAGEVDEAIAALETLKVRTGSRDAALLTELAMAYSEAGDDDAALDHAELAYDLAPMNAAAADTYGWALFQAGEQGAALQLLQKAATLAPAQPLVRWHLAQVYAALGRRPEARRNALAAAAAPGFGDRAAAQALAARQG